MRDERMRSPFDAGQAQAAIRRDQDRARVRPPVSAFGHSGRLHMQVDHEAVMNAVNVEGPEVLTDEAGDEYWRDMKRLHPWTDTMPNKGPGRLAGMKNRLGRVVERTVYRKRYGAGGEGLQRKTFREREWEIERSRAAHDEAPH